MRRPRSSRTPCSRWPASSRACASTPATCAGTPSAQSGAGPASRSPSGASSGRSSAASSPCGSTAPTSRLPRPGRCVCGSWASRSSARWWEASCGVEIAKRAAGVTASTGDAFVVPLAVGIAIGRMGCFVAGLHDDTYGNATTLPWGVDFGDGVARHPTQLYDIAFVCAAALVLVRAAADARARAGPVVQAVPRRLSRVALRDRFRSSPCTSPIPADCPDCSSSRQSRCSPTCRSSCARCGDFDDPQDPAVPLLRHHDQRVRDLPARRRGEDRAARTSASTWTSGAPCTAPSACS